MRTVLAVIAASVAVATFALAKAHADNNLPVLTYGSVTLAAHTATKVPDPLKSATARKGIGIANLDTATIYCGGDASVTDTNGWPVFSQAKDGLGAGFQPNYNTSPVTFYGQVYCYSVAGTTSNAVRWIEVR